MSDVILYDYWRSSASYRVRIALNLAGIDYRSEPVSLLKQEHRTPEYLARNPQGLVPALFIDGQLLTQSLAIIEYISETRDAKFLPQNPLDRARVRALAHAIAMDIHPVCNLSVVNYAAALTDTPEETTKAWMQKFVGRGLAALEVMLQRTDGPLCFGDTPSLADICLVPQVYNAKRWDVNLSTMPRILGIVDELTKIDAFARSAPQKPA
jgi:maleylacetoacetate isomerase